MPKPADPLFKRVNTRAAVTYGHDIVMTALSFVASVFMRLGDNFSQISPDHLLSAGGTLTIIAAVVYWFSGMYKGIWRYASIPDLTVIARAVTLTLLVFLLVMFVWTRLDSLPRSLPFINWLVLMAFLGGPRLAYRVIRDRRFDLARLADGKARIPVLLIGAGDGAEAFIRSLNRLHGSEYRIVGIVSERAHRVGQRILGVSVLGTVENLTEVVEQLTSTDAKPQRMILTKDSFDGAVIRDLFDQADGLGIGLARVPAVTEFKSGDPDKIEVRPIDVEDLLGRPQTSLDQKAMRALVENKSIMVTGAGGSIGSELVRQISTYGPSKIGLLESSEYALYLIDREIAQIFPDLQRDSIIADVRNADRIEEIWKGFRPDVVFHAAALKHVPIVEANSREGVETNVFGTVHVADACIRNGVATMVQISTDKAINPTNVMGATKRIAEQYCQALNLERDSGHDTRFVTVRFGNVLGSTGSVVPLFQQQLQNGGPLTVTHKNMTRFFMTVREAVQLVILASAMATARRKRDGRIYVLDMGKPVKIMDLAEQMIRLAGFEPGRDVQIEITGCRPGEKLYEEIFHGSEEIIQTNMPGVLLATPRTASLQDMKDRIGTLSDVCENEDDVSVMKVLSDMVPESSLGNRENKN